jgi:hypothetical protein
VTEPRDLPSDVVEDAILAFDAGNHAWGRYRHFVLSTNVAAQAVSTAAVREALGEAAIDVLDAKEGDYWPLLTSLRRTLEHLRTYRSALPPDIQQSELEEAADNFTAAIALLEGRGADE